MNWNGLLVGAVTFFLIGIFHVIVIKTEYYFSKKVWPVFLVIGIGLLILSTRFEGQTASSLTAVVGISCLWSIRELFQQEMRVKKGWFPKRQTRRQEPRR